MRSKETVPKNTTSPNIKSVIFSCNLKIEERETKNFCQLKKKIYFYK